MVRSLRWVGPFGRELCLLLSLPATSVAWAADVPPATAPPLVERLDVRVVDVEVTVTDGAGNPVRDLGPEDFTVLEDGAPQPISNFYLVDRTQVRAGVDRAWEPIDPRSRFRRRAVLLVDNNTVSQVDRDRALDAASDFVAETYDQSYEWAVLAVGDNLEVVQPLTTEGYVVQAAIDRLRATPTLLAQVLPDRHQLEDASRTLAINARRESGDARQVAEGDPREPLRLASRDNARRNLLAAKRVGEAMLRAFAAYGGLDGQKVMVLVTGGIELLPELAATEADLEASAALGAGGSRDGELRVAHDELRALVAQLARAANAAGFRVYPLKAGGLRSAAPKFDASVGSSGTLANPAGFLAAAEIDDNDSAQLQLAAATGGLYAPGNDLRASFDLVHHDAATYYSLGYRPPHPADGAFHAIEVRVARPGVRVRARQGYVDLSPLDRLARAMATPLTFEKSTGVLPVVLAVTPPEAPGQPATARAEVPMRRLTFLPRGEEEMGRVVVILTLYDGRGEVVDQVRRSRDLAFAADRRYEARSADLVQTLSFPLAERGAYTVAVTVVDELSGESGSAFARLQI